MNKAELVEGIASSAGVSKRMAEKVLDATIDVITNTMASGDKVQLVGFGTFEVKERSGRTGRNPKTNEVVMIKPTRSPCFKAGKNLKDIVSGAVVPQ